MLITSQARVLAADSDRIEVTPSSAQKCERCWHYRADVDAHADHPGLCGRCVSNLHGDGEVRTPCLSRLTLHCANGWAWRWP